MILSVEQFLEQMGHSAIAHPFGFPTETVYGLAAPILRADLIAEIFEVKKRPFFDPLIVHVVDPIEARTLSSGWSEICDVLVTAFWPGPLTLVVPKASTVSDLITSGLGTVGLRCPDHEGALKILSVTGPLAAPSANRFGHTSPTTALHVVEELGSELLVVDGGPCRIGIESTVLEVNGSELTILRPGAVLKSDIESALAGKTFSFVAKTSGIAGPGQLKHHYMPDVPLVILRDQKIDDVLLADIKLRMQNVPDEFEGVKLRKSENLRSAFELNLSVNPAMAARELYSKLREVADGRPDFIYFRKKPGHEIPEWLPVMDRLTKAALINIS